MHNSVDDLQQALSQHDYIAERGLSVAIYLALKTGKPLFLEGDAGVGKTEIAKVLAEMLDTQLIRLQCYEGLDINTAVYEWNYAGQILHLRLMEREGLSREDMESELFSPRFLLKRPLLQAIEGSQNGAAPVLLIDELDRSDEEFEAFLLELLSDFQITIPELGTLKAAQPPVVVVTSNRTREIHDALKRRCLYFWIDYPQFAKELRIVERKAPDVPPMLARQITAFIQDMRSLELFKRPGIAETLDWTAALIALDQRELSLEAVQDTLGVILKYQDDVEMLDAATIQNMLERARVEAQRAS
ncbi:MAG: MoxR family ATPase [Chloroflexi bacterium]|nr:MoxR family ATPase [Chloroflexota bacterium]MCY3582786.1 MoxR family ATPase [Chloroflexota bacterium]MCY3716139.1 MoxR family ATPase [Chloroflexota bacterium]MDE2650957.1 MoxR family ATPase [Chloroflexota bacterium]MXV93268.1 MoxR family ATPase [Chloroflexota bacterium]